MAWKLLGALVIASWLSACEPYAGPTATCFTLLEGEGPCEFRPVPAAAP